LARKRLARTTFANAVIPVLTFATLIFLWWAAIVVFEIPRFLIPPPQSVLPSMIDNAYDLWRNAQFTVTAILLGFGASVIFSIPMGLAIALSARVRQAVYPVLVFIQLIPKIAIAPLFLIWFGFGLEPKVFLTALLTFFPLLLASIAGFQQLDPRLLYLTRSMGCSRWQTFRHVRLPSALPVIFSGLKTSATIAATAALVSEFVGSNAGLGFRLMVATVYLDTPLIFAILLILTILGLGLNYIVEVIEYFVMPWKRATQQS
jgi:NitT/TauT family transport system permease protein